jgi:hypothetical protein
MFITLFRRLQFTSLHSDYRPLEYKRGYLPKRLYLYQKTSDQLQDMLLQFSEQPADSFSRQFLKNAFRMITLRLVVLQVFFGERQNFKPSCQTFCLACFLCILDRPIYDILVLSMAPHSPATKWKVTSFLNPELLFFFFWFYSRVPALTAPMMLLRFSLCITAVFQMPTPMFVRSPSTLSSHLVGGRLTLLLPCSVVNFNLLHGNHYYGYKFLTALKSRSRPISNQLHVAFPVAYLSI